jgi:ubiquinone/menaquinone biosynthesis C-methylase UbiE
MPDAVEPDHWFEPIADHLGSAYLRYSFTMGTAQEVSYLVAALGLEPGRRVLDVGCGPGRHAHELARRGITCHGVDISERFVALAREHAPEGATFERGDARALAFDAEFDAVVSLCQGGFGLVLGAGEDLTVLDGMVRAIRPGGRLAVTAFNAYFQVRHHTEATWDADAGVAHERTEVRDEQGVAAEVDLWTACYTPRELRLLARLVGLRVDAISAVEPGAYGDAPPDTEHAELLVLATRP